MSKAIQSVRSASYIYIYIYSLVRKLRILSPFTFNRSFISFTPLVVILGLGLLGFTTLSGALFSSPVHAESVKYDVNVNSSLTLGFSDNTVSLNLNPGSKTFASQDITTTVSTNNQYGYDLYVTSDGTDLINQTDNTKTIPTLPAKDGGYSADTFLADKWGVMKNNTSYQPFVSGATVSQSNTVTNADNTVLTFGAKTSYNTAPGNYKLALNFQLVARVATNDLTINFAGEGVEAVKVCKEAGNCTGNDLIGTVNNNGGSGGSVPGLKDGSTYYLYPIFSSGYEFVSWAKNSSDASVISDTTILNPTFTMSDEPASVTVMGKSSCISTISGYMQSASASSVYCDGATGSMTDRRDSQDYTVAKINGNLWMTKNLAIGCNGSSRNIVTLTSSDSNVSSDYTISSSAVPNFDSSNNSDTSGYTTAAMMCSSNSSYGAWYNYKAATAGTITGESNKTNATKDICPAGWRLPTNSEQSGITGYSSAFSPVTGGRYVSGSLGSTGSGLWWSATAYDAIYRYRLLWSSSSLNTDFPSRAYRYVGAYVRCIRS